MQPPIISRFSIISREELRKLPKPEWLIESAIEAIEMSMLFGAPGAGKTYVALDMALCIATGTPWMGNKTQIKSVLYAFGEGAPGINDRVAAWEKFHSCGAGKNINFLATTPKLIDRADMDELFTAIDKLDKPPSLIVIDTLSRAIAGGEENSAKEMSVVVEACGDLQKRYKAAVLLVHHTSKSTGTARGSSVIEGAVNTMINVKKDKNNIRTISCEKQKNDREFLPMKFKLVDVDIPGGSSCVVQQTQTHNSYQEVSSRDYLSDNQKLIMTLFKNNPDVIFPTKEIKNESRIATGSLQRTINELMELGLLDRVDKGLYRLTDEGIGKA